MELKDIQACNRKETSGFGVLSFSTPVYLRFGMSKRLNFTLEDRKDFEVGKNRVFCKDTDVTIFACGHMVEKVKKTGGIKEIDGLGVELLNLHTIRPLDSETIADVETVGGSS